MTLSLDDVKRVALLARLQIEPELLPALTDQLGKVVDLVGQLQELNTDSVEPMVHAIELSNVLAEDVQAAGLTRDQALANSPQHDAECFRVPAVMG